MREDFQGWIKGMRLRSMRSIESVCFLCHTAQPPRDGDKDR